MSVPNRANDSRRQSKPREYRTEVNKTSRGQVDKDNPIITKTEYKEKHGWVSPWPTGHSNHTSMVTADEQAENMRNRD